MNALIQTKIAPPVWMGEQIRREALLALLDGALERRLTLVHAPAGYGKTSLLAQWRQRHMGGKVLTAWLTLERDDSDLNRLVQYLALAMHGAEPGKTKDADAGLAPADLPPRAALSAILSHLAAEPRQVVLILDDVHRAENPSLPEFLGSLIRLASENCHFVIASRDYPQLGQSVLAAEEQLLEFSAEDLRSSTPETEALFARRQDLCIDDDLMRRIRERTEGWPIALQLIFLSLKRGCDPQQLVDRFSGPSSELARYLSEQVLMALPAEIQEVVTRTALVDHLTGDLVNTLCERQDGWLMLERLEQQGVFLAPLSDDGQAYRYHQLFAEYLREHLARRDQAQYRALQRTAARWFAGRGNVTEAIGHAIHADDSALLADILEEAGAWRLIPKGLQNVAARALEHLTDAVARARPRLLLMRVYLAIKNGELGAARADYDWLVANAEQAGFSPDLWTELHIVEDVLVEYENVPVTLDDLLAREALLRTMPSNDHMMLGNFCESLAGKYYEGGWLERAIEPTLAAREHHQALGSLYSDLFTRFLESRIKRAQGRLKEAAGILANARRQIEEHFGARSDLAANGAAFEADLLYDQDRLAEAAALLEWSLPHMERSDGWVDVYAAAYFTAARIAAADGAMDRGRVMLARAGRLARRRRLRQLELLAQLCELELLIQHGGHDERARATAQMLGLDALADEMALDTAVYRPVAVQATLCRAQLKLIDEAHAQALEELAALRQWATRHGAGRLLIQLNLLIAHGLLRMDQATKARREFDDAVGMAMFQGIVRPFIDARRFVEPLHTVARGASPVDRFREQFLKHLARAFASRAAKGPDQGQLTEAELVVLTHLSQGYSNKEIARRIGVSPDTVKYRLKSLFRKIGVNKRRDAVALLRERGLVGEPEA